MRAKFQSYTVAEFVDKYLRLFLNGSMGAEMPARFGTRARIDWEYDFTLAFDDQGGAFGSPAAQTATPPAATVPSGLPDIFNAVEQAAWVEARQGQGDPARRFGYRPHREGPKLKTDWPLAGRASQGDQVIGRPGRPRYQAGC